MAPYFPIYLARSDGTLETGSKSGGTVPNAPTEKQLQGVTDKRGARTYYKELEIGDPKEIDWRRKLGGMLMREIGDKEQQSWYIYYSTNGFRS